MNLLKESLELLKNKKMEYIFLIQCPVESVHFNFELPYNVPNRSLLNNRRVSRHIIGKISIFPIKWPFYCKIDPIIQSFIDKQNDKPLINIWKWTIKTFEFKLLKLFNDKFALWTFFLSIFILQIVPYSKNERIFNFLE
jgi:hypothetical protein